MCIFGGQKNWAANHLAVSAVTLSTVVLIVVCLNRAQTSSDGAGWHTVTSHCLVWGVIFRVESEVIEEEQVRALTVPPALFPRGGNQAAVVALCPASLSHNVAPAFRRADLAPYHSSSSTKYWASSANPQVSITVWGAGRRKMCHRNVSWTWFKGCCWISHVKFRGVLKGKGKRSNEWVLSSGVGSGFLNEWKWVIFFFFFKWVIWQ